MTISGYTPFPLKPASLLGILLELIDEVARPGGYPSDARVGRFFRSRRYLGSRDRRFLGDGVYAWLRHHWRARARWQSWCLRNKVRSPLAVAEGEGKPASESTTRASRAVHILDLLALARDGLFPWGHEQTTQALAAIPELADRTLDLIPDQALSSDFLAGDPWPDDPLERVAAEVSLPLWLAWRLVDERGEEAARRFGAALLKPASVDLRVNLRLVKRENVRRKLESETGLEVEPTHFSPMGLRLAGRTNLTATTASRKSWIEVQDEGSQLVVLSADPAPGMTVIDACAGSGGKTLALADILFRDEPFRQEVDTAGLVPARGGTITVMDIAESRLAELERRAKDAGVVQHIERMVLLAETGPLPLDLPEADLVLVDAPCTGFGTLRRNPELKLRYTKEDVKEFSRLQRSLLERFAPLVKKGGRLAYVTCSFLRAECEEVALAFEQDHPEFDGAPSTWAATRLPPLSVDGHFVRLDPVLTGTDAFFLALWQRRGPVTTDDL